MIPRGKIKSSRRSRSWFSPDSQNSPERALPPWNREFHENRFEINLRSCGKWGGPWTRQITDRYTGWKTVRLSDGPKHKFEPCFGRSWWSYYLNFFNITPEETLYMFYRETGQSLIGKPDFFKIIMFPNIKWGFLQIIGIRPNVTRKLKLAWNSVSLTLLPNWKSDN